MILSFKEITRRSTRVLGLAVFLLFAVACEDDPIDVDDRTQWLGAWDCNETDGDFSPQSYTITIYEGVQLDEVEISGLYNQGNNFRVYANVYNRQLTIPLQTVNGITLQGNWTMLSSGNRVDIQFTANDGGGNDNVAGYLSR